MMHMFKGIHSVDIKIFVSDDADAIKTESDAVKRLEALINQPDEFRFKVSKSVNLKELQAMLVAAYPESITASESIRGGCYGARDGSIHSGLVVHVDAWEFPERWSTEDDMGYTEWYNPVALLADHSKRVDIDDAESLFEQVDHNSDNSYNWSGQSERVEPLFDFDLRTFKTESGQLIAGIMFHHGGDPRGNYGSRYLFVFESDDDFYSFALPCYFGKEDTE